MTPRPTPTSAGPSLERLAGIMTRLRAEGGCPWDREQDLRSLRPYLVEETYEVLDEMDRVGNGGPWRPLCEELGDLLFQIVFHSQLATELGEFSLADVCSAISDKLESRHPHVFGDAHVTTAEQVLDNWAELKAAEKKRKTGSEGSVLDGVPSAAPALLRAERLTEKASRIGFDWPDLAGVRGKLDEELRELDDAIAGKNLVEIEHELGDVLFSLSNLARFLHTPAEDALRQAIVRFTSRFHHIEAGLREEKIPFGKATLAQMDALWEQAKTREHTLPKPLHLPRASVARLTLGCAKLEPMRSFFTELTPLLGWTQRDAREGVCYDTGAFELALAERSGAGAVELSLEAASAAAVELLHGALLGLASKGTLAAPIEHLPNRSVTFTDPEGNRYRYALAGAKA